MRCPACNTSNPPENQRCQHCGEALPPARERPVAEEEVDVLAVLPVSTAGAGKRRPARAQEADEEEETDLVSTFIPYRNPKALAAYYCGFFALLPVVGFILGVVAVILGIQGVRYANAHPTAKGAAHAITGIILGVVAFFCWNPIVLFLGWFNFWYLP